MDRLLSVSKEKTTALLLLFIAVAAYFLKYGLNAFLAHRLSPAFYGDFSVATRTLAIVSSLVLLGTVTSSKRFVLQYIAKKNEQDLRDFIAWNARTVAISFLVCLAVAFLSSALMFALHYWGVKQIDSYHLVIYTLWVAPLSSLSILLTSYILCANRPVYSQVFLKLQYIFMIGLFVLASLYLDKAIDSTVILSTWGLTFFCVCVLEMLFISVAMKVPGGMNISFSSMKKIDSEKTSQWKQVSRNFIVSNLAFDLLCAMDLFLVEIFAQHEGDIGRYAVLLTITAIIALLPSSMLNGLKPKLGKLIHDVEGRKALQKSINSVNMLLIPMMLACLLVIVFFGRFFLSHFGKDYASLSIELDILALSGVVGSLTIIAKLILAYSGLEAVLLKLTLFRLVATILLVSLGVYFAGLMGVVTMILLISIFQSATSLYIVRKRFALKTIGFI